MEKVRKRRSQQRSYHRNPLSPTLFQPKEGLVRACKLSPQTSEVNRGIYIFNNNNNFSLLDAFEGTVREMGLPSSNSSPHHLFRKGWREGSGFAFLVPIFSGGGGNLASRIPPRGAGR